MSFKETDVKTLLEKDNAHLDDGKEQKFPMYNKQRLYFICNCGKSCDNEIRGIRNHGAFCKECMQEKKRRLIKEKKKRPVQIPTQFEQRCRNCSNVYNLSHFESKVKGEYTYLCTKCRKTANKCRIKKKVHMDEKVPTDENNIICNLCGEEKSKDMFINDNNGSETKRCKDCREKLQEQGKKRKTELQEKPVESDEKKCDRCLMNRNFKEYISDDKICETCIESAQNCYLKKQERRRQKRLDKIEQVLGERYCEKCNEFYALSEFSDVKGNLCMKCGDICSCCEKNKLKSEFSSGSSICFDCKASNKHDKHKFDKMYKLDNFVYTYENLQLFLQNAGATFIRVLDVPLLRESKVEFLCKCGNKSVQCFISLRKKLGALCMSCKTKQIVINQRATMLEKYGVTNSMHMPNTLQKYVDSCYKSKLYTLPSGKSIKVQGYESFALDDLFKSGVHENDINYGKDRPMIKYLYDGNTKCYHPDIHIISTNTIIEVKSDYMYNLDKQKNLAKQQSCINNGYNFEFWIYDRKKNKTVLK